MRKRSFVRKIAAVAVMMAMALVLFTACGKGDSADSQKNTDTPTEAVKQVEAKEETPKPSNDAVTSAQEQDASDAADQNASDEAGQNTSDEAGQNTSGETASSESGMSELIKKVQGASDDSGIYTFIVTMSDKIADEGTLEYIYHGTKGSAHENEIVCTFIANYYKEESGTYDIMTYYDGMINTHLTHKNEVKVDNTFGAMVRAGSVTVYYTPKDGEKIQIYYADDEEFRH